MVAEASGQIVKRGVWKKTSRPLSMVYGLPLPSSKREQSIGKTSVVKTKRESRNRHENFWLWRKKSAVFKTLKTKQPCGRKAVCFILLFGQPSENKVTMLLIVNLLSG